MVSETVLAQSNAIATTGSGTITLGYVLYSSLFGDKFYIKLNPVNDQSTAFVLIEGTTAYMVLIVV